jgi:hypothetical protein
MIKKEGEIENGEIDRDDDGNESSIDKSKNSSNFGKSYVRCGKSQELANISFDSEREKVVESLTIDFQKSIEKEQLSNNKQTKKKLNGFSERNLSLDENIIISQGGISNDKLILLERQRQRALDEERKKYEEKHYQLVDEVCLLLFFYILFFLK